MTEDYKTVFNILNSALWESNLPKYRISDKDRKELRNHSLEGFSLLVDSDNSDLKYSQIVRFVQMASTQAKAIRLLQNASIPVAVIKGMAAGMYYPLPYLRTYGDIDLLVHPENYEEAIHLLENGGFQKGNTEEPEATEFYDQLFIIELHRYPSGLIDVNEGKYISDYILSGLSNIQNIVIDQPYCTFPVLPWKQNGLELIWHIRVHLYNGIGLRQIIDWMMFVHCCLNDNAFFNDYEIVLEKAGLLKLARVVTKMCQMYLGLSKEITWCSDVEDNICSSLMDYIMEQGDFGKKMPNDKAVKALIGYKTPISFWKAMQKKGVRDWGLPKKYRILRPFAWIYTLIEGFKWYANKEGPNRLSEDLSENRKRRELFEQLYGDKWEKQSRTETNTESEVHRITYKQYQHYSIKNRIRPIYEIVRSSFLRIPLYYMQNFYFYCRYHAFGIPSIPRNEIENVENNITFIFKSFNRQKRAEKLYWSIKNYYPKAKVIIADDSEIPLCINRFDENDVIIHLPFNSGLSKGLALALELVKTPYVMRLDDDLLLTPSSNIHKQLSFLQSNKNVDLAAIQMTHWKPERSAELYNCYRMKKKLIIPAGTIIDGHIVVYKAPNVYLARTESLKIIGYDPNIRMMEHHEFFYRAAGKIVCVQDPRSYVMHCHNLFEKKNYTKYRRDIGDDADYIARKHGSVY